VRLPCANPIVSCGSLQLSVLHIAAERGDEEMLKCLLQTKAAALIDAQNAKGDTPLHLAVQAEHDVIIVQLLEAGAYHKIKNGNSFFHFSIIFSYIFRKNF